MADELCDLPFEITRQAKVFEQNAIFECVVPALDPGLTTTAWLIPVVSPITWSSQDLVDKHIGTRYQNFHHRERDRL